MRFMYLKVQALACLVYDKELKSKQQQQNI